MLVSYISAFLYIAIPISNSQNSIKSNGGWLYRPNGPANIVRFEVVADTPGDSKSFVPYRATGYIILNHDSFCISLAELLGSALFEYNKGILTENVVGDLGDIHSQPGISMTYEQGLKSALSAFGSDGLSAYCIKLLADTTLRKVNEIQRSCTSDGSTINATLGPGRGTLLKYTVQLLIPNNPLISRRSVMTFSVVSK